MVGAPAAAPGGTAVKLVAAATGHACIRLRWWETTVEIASCNEGSSGIRTRKGNRDMRELVVGLQVEASLD